MRLAWGFRFIKQEGPRTIQQSTNLTIHPSNNGNRRPSEQTKAAKILEATMPRVPELEKWKTPRPSGQLSKIVCYLPD